MIGPSQAHSISHFTTAKPPRPEGEERTWVSPVPLPVSARRPCLERRGWGSSRPKEGRMMGEGERRQVSVGSSLLSSFYPKSGQ